MRVPMALLLTSLMVASAAAQSSDRPTPRPIVRLLSPVADDGPPRELPPPSSADAAKKAPAESSSTGASPAPTAATLAATHIDLAGVKTPVVDDSCPECCFLCGVPSRLTLRADFGDGVGYTRGFTYLEGFVPFYQPDACSVVFGDGRVVNFLDDDRWEFNAGAGYRRYFEPSDVVLGASLFYDGRHTDSHFFHQIGVGGEALLDRWEFRLNGYFIVGPSHKLIAQSEVASLVSNLLIVDRFQINEVAMGGLDAEVGALLPVLPQISPRVFAGYYHYSAERMPSINGVRARFEAWLSQNVSLHAAIQNDAVFDTTVSGGFAIHFGGARVRRDGGPRSPEERLGQRVVRDPDIVIAQQLDHQRDVFVIDIVRSPTNNGVSGTSGTSPPPSTTTPPPSTTTPPPSTTTPPPDPVKKPAPDPGTKPSPGVCLPFPGKPGDPATFPGKHFPPGFHHDCFPGLGRYKHLLDDDDWRELRPQNHGLAKGHKNHDD